MSEHDRSALLSRLDEVTVDYERRIAALTAAPEKPRVDVRKVFDSIERGGYCFESGALSRMDILACALRAAGVETVE